MLDITEEKDRWEEKKEEGKGMEGRKKGQKERKKEGQRTREGGTGRNKAGIDAGHKIVTKKSL